MSVLETKEEEEEGSGNSNADTDADADADAGDTHADGDDSSADNSTNVSQSHSHSHPSRHIVFLHLDLGIGGAEQLVINLALASLPPTSTTASTDDDKSSDANLKSSSSSSSSSLNAKVSILTTHCDQNHCFDAVRQSSDSNSNPSKPGTPGILANSVHVVGEFIPVSIFGKGTAFCSTLRMLYLSHVGMKMFPDADVFVLDILPSPIPYMVYGRGRGGKYGNENENENESGRETNGNGAKCVIYYCHFPDKLLTRDTVNGEKSSMTVNGSSNSNSGLMNIIKYQYRSLLDKVEEWTMSYADLVCVNSEFTKMEVLRAFPSLRKEVQVSDRDGRPLGMQVLYPSIDLDKFIPPDFERKEILMKANVDVNVNININANAKTTDTDDDENVDLDDKDLDLGAPIVSLNRFERKKNIGILLHAYAKLYNHQKNNTNTNYSNTNYKLPYLVIAGGYDPRNTENIEYLTELQHLSQSLGIQNRTLFRPNVSDDERAMLLQSATCVVYTPHREHFGIVPLEAMFAGSAVIAMKSGGPKETVLDGVTGILVDVNVDAGDCKVSGDGGCDKLAKAMEELLLDPHKAIRMGKSGHEHIKNKFGIEPFRKEWKKIVEEQAIPQGKKRRQQQLQQRGISFGHLAMLVALIAWYLGRFVYSISN